MEVRSVGCGDGKIGGCNKYVFDNFCAICLSVIRINCKKNSFFLKLIFEM